MDIKKEEKEMDKPIEIKPSLDVSEVVQQAPVENKQYKLTSWKKVIDRNGDEVEVEDRVEVISLLQIDLQIAEVQKRLDDLQAKKALIEG